MVDTANLTSRELQALSTRAVIVDAAEEQFLRDGFAGASLGAIAAAAKISKGLIIHHFKTKEALWAAVIERQQEEMIEAMAGMQPADGGDLEALRTFFLAYFRWLQANPQHVRFLLLRALEGGDPPTDLAFQTMLPWIEQAQDAGLLRDDLPAALLLQAMIGQIRAWHASKGLLAGNGSPPPREAEQVGAALFNLFIDGARAG